jgi:hypothetical protein
MNREDNPQTPAHREARSRRPAIGKLPVILVVLVVALAGLGAYRFLGVPARADSPPANPGPELKLIPVSALSDKVRGAPQAVQEAYRFAAANPDVLSRIPCYCGCGMEGHKSNLDCYVKQTGADGSIVFDDHALNCGICVDIAHDVMLLLQEGKNLKEIRTYIDTQYAKYGQPTKTEPVL